MSGHVTSGQSSFLKGSSFKNCITCYLQYPNEHHEHSEIPNRSSDIVWHGAIQRHETTSQEP